MKVKTLIIVGLILSACAGPTESEINEGPVTTETTEKIKVVQDANVELEEIDGELDSLLNELN